MRGPRRRYWRCAGCKGTFAEQAGEVRVWLVPHQNGGLFAWCSAACAEAFEARWMLEYGMTYGEAPILDAKGRVRSKVASAVLTCLAGVSDATVAARTCLAGANGWWVWERREACASPTSRRIGVDW